MWQILIEGNKADLQDITDLFSKEKEGFEIKKEDGQSFIEINTSEKRVEKILQKGEQIVSLVTGILKIVLGKDSTIKLSDTKHVRKVDEKTSRKMSHITIFHDLSQMASVEATVKDLNGNTVRKYPDDTIKYLVSSGLSDQTVNRVLKLAVNLDDWTNLYRIYEIIEGDMKSINEIVDRGWATKNKIKLFKHTANSPGAIGDKARHGRETTNPPPKPMTLLEASALIKRLIMNWIEFKRLKR